MKEIGLDVTQDIEEILERIDIVLGDGGELLRLDYYKKSKKLIAVVSEAA